MGEVYRAHDETLGREVAIKVLSPAFMAEPERRARFEREARMLARWSPADRFDLRRRRGRRRAALVLNWWRDRRTIYVRGASAATHPASVSEGSIARQIADAPRPHEKGIIHRD
jgi:serine/threonine-protein kinase